MYYKKRDASERQKIMNEEANEHAPKRRYKRSIMRVLKLAKALEQSEFCVVDDKNNY